MKQIPQLVKQGKTQALLVDGKPFFLRGGELHNSSASSLSYMEEHIWPALRDLQLNTVVLPITWELLEPRQGEFDFSLPEGLILQARRENVRLVLLWFGLWKNAESTYTPDWVRTDTAQYFRVRDAYGQPLRTVSPLCEAAVKADAAAFSALMRHVEEFDREDRTVVLVQVENETGLIGTGRDYCEAGQAAFAAEIPPAVAAEFGVQGSWAQAFGEEADEQFMAWCFSRAVGAVAAAGQAAYPLPMYANAWLEQFPDVPGKYPSGGPVWKMHRMWKLDNPSISFLSPDIYVDWYREVCDEYAQEGNPLFIPEVRNTADSVPFLFYAVGKHALGFSPFGVEDMGGVEQQTDETVLGLLNIQASAVNTDMRAGKLLSHAYGLLSQMDEVLFQAQSSGTVQGFLELHDRGVILPLRDCDLKITYDGQGSFLNAAPPKTPGAPVAGGFVLEADGSIYLTGMCFTAEFLPKKDSGVLVDVLQKEEGRFVANRWERGRVLNGDERYVHHFGVVPETQRFTLYRYA